MDATPVLLREVLYPLSRHYGDPATVEVRAGRAGRLVVERRGAGKATVQDEAVTLATVERICRTLANYRGLEWDADRAPKLSCVLPGGHRFECLVGASVQSGLSLAIRCKHPFVPSWRQAGLSDGIRDYLLDAVAAERNVIVSGATNTGKTTLLNMLIETLPEDRRVIGVEDTPELHLGRFWDGVGLLAAREATGDSGMVSWRQLYDHLMRATPDHIVFGEISTQNAFAALAALNSGVTGFMCSIHAESPEQAIHRKFDQNIAWSGETMPNVPEYLSELVDVVVQLKRTPDGYRHVTDIFEPRANAWVLRDGKEVG